MGGARTAGTHPFQHSEVTGSFRSSHSTGIPDLHLLSVDVAWVPPGSETPTARFSINAALLKPRSQELGDPG